MANFISNFLHSYNVLVQVTTIPDEQGFRLVAPGLLGQTYLTSPALTAQILASPEFDTLSGSEKAQRILEVLLSAA